jgi:uncharacterized protein
MKEGRGARGARALFLSLRRVVMEQRDLELIQKHSHNDKSLASLYHEHLDFERKLEKYNNKPFLTPSEEVERKNLQKMKLRGRDLIERILQEYRKADSLS